MLFPDGLDFRFQALPAVRLHVFLQLGVKVAVVVGHLAIFQESKCVQKGQAIEPDQVKENILGRGTKPSS